MSPETKSLLLKHDLSMSLKHLDYDEFVSRIKEVAQTIEIFLPGATPRPTQNAQFWGSISLPGYLETYQVEGQQYSKRPSLIFSLYGNLASIGWEELLPDDVKAKVIDVAESSGFILIDKSDLDEPYDGFHNDQKDFIKTWNDRYFNWL